MGACRCCGGQLRRGILPASSSLGIPQAVNGLVERFKYVVQPGNVFRMAKEQVTPRLEKARHLAQKDILGVLLEIDQSIAEENGVERAFHRPSGVHEVDAPE